MWADHSNSISQEVRERKVMQSFYQSYGENDSILVPDFDFDGMLKRNMCVRV